MGAVKLWLYSAITKHERVGRVDASAPLLRVVVLVVREPRVLRLVEERQVELDEVDQIDVEAAVCLGAADDPGADLVAHATGPRARDDDHQPRRHLGCEVDMSTKSVHSRRG